MTYLAQIIKALSSHKKYVVYSLAYGLSTLIIPLSVQYLVNNLALSGIWLNISVFLLIIFVGLVISQIIKHSQLILIESLQREIFCHEITQWKKAPLKQHSHYYFEVHNLLKSFSKSYANIIELCLVIFFGLTTILMFHPMFIVLPVLIGTTIYLIYRTSYYALKTSICESTEKYKIFHLIDNNEEVKDSDVMSFLGARDDHFNFIRRNSLFIGALVVLVQIVLLALGCYLVSVNQLSVGQLVSAEIIISGIFTPIQKLPLTLEAVYDYETSKYKMEMALKGDQYE